jgi:cytochrome oxidase Cu insertion factor (SCO1/SenC/PrrC family)
MNEVKTESGKKNPYTLWFVVLSFIVPVVLAYMIFYFVDVKSFSNHGEILNPIVDIASLKLKDEEHKVIPRDDLTYKWRLISLVGDQCDSACVSRLHDSRQVYRSLGKNRHRVIRMFVHMAPASEELSKLIEEEHADAIQVNGNAVDLKDAFGETSNIMKNEIYVMDPMGNIMMRFTQEQPNKDFLYDLRKLLKFSQIG